MAPLGLLDSLLTALFYIAGYGLLRLAGVGRLLAGAALTVAVLALIYGMFYGVGALPETGPLRFGLPLALILAEVMRARAPGRGALPGAAALVVLGISAVWAFEAFVYTALTFAAIGAVRAWLSPEGDRWRWLARQALLALGACVAAHVAAGHDHAARERQPARLGPVLHLSPLVSVRRDCRGHQLRIRRLVPGARGRCGGVRVGGRCGATAAAGAPDRPRRAGNARRAHRPSAYMIGLLSYTDNRSSTYLLTYVTLPLLLVATVWLGLLLRRREESAAALRTGAVAFAVALSALMISAAWPVIGHNFSETALAKAYPGGGLRAAVHRLCASAAESIRARLRERDCWIATYPGTHAIVVLPTAPDLGVEILMRARRANALFIADPVDDSLVPALWMSRLKTQVAKLRPGQRLLIDTGAEMVLAGLRTTPSIDPVVHPIAGGNQQLEWLLRELDRRFRIVPIYRDPDGLIVAELASRRS